MSNAERIVRSLDQHLDHEVSLVIYGRAAIALGFDAAPESVKRSLDIDAIIPEAVTMDRSGPQDESNLVQRSTSNGQPVGEACARPETSARC